MRKRVVYVAGPFRGVNAWAVEQNVRRAEDMSLRIYEAGMVPLCPHTQGRYFDGALDDQVFLDGTMELLLRCDAVMLVSPNAHMISEGTAGEVNAAGNRGMPVFSDFDELLVWLELLQGGGEKADIADRSDGSIDGGNCAGEIASSSLLAMTGGLRQAQPPEGVSGESTEGAGVAAMDILRTRSMGSGHARR